MKLAGSPDHYGYQRKLLEPSFSKFSVKRRLGAGGMGVVYEAEDLQRKSTVALKTLAHTDPVSLYLLKQEFRSLAGISHRNLVRLYELYSEGETWFFTMEFLEGTSFLSHVRAAAHVTANLEPAKPLASESAEDATQTITHMTAATIEGRDEPGMAGALPVRDYDRLRNALRQLAAGLSALHGHGKLHRDVKPPNVMVTPEGRVVILDFGLIQELGDKDLMEASIPQLAGTIQYMSPEQASSEPLTPASDWYSVGVMLFEALTGRRPFPGDGRQVLAAKRSEDAPPPSQFAPGIPDDLEWLCRRLLSRDPALRPSANEIWSTLGPEQEGDVAPIREERPRRDESLVGRESHLETLRQALATVSRGKTVVVRIHGDSGAGKSALVGRFLRGVRQRGDCVILQGQSYERESVPYKALDSLMDSLSSYLRRLDPSESSALLPRDIHILSRLFPVLQRAEAVQKAPVPRSMPTDLDEQRRRAYEALSELFAKIGDRWLLVLSIDDLQWGDLDSGLLLSDMLRGPKPPTLLLLCSYRREGAKQSPCLEALFNAEFSKSLSVIDLPVDPLDEEAAIELASGLAGAGQDRERLAAIARESGGNPYFLAELVRFTKSGTDPAQLDSAGSSTLDALIWDRVTGLPTNSRRLLEIVAVSGRPLAQRAAWTAAGIESLDPGETESLRIAKLIRTQGVDELDEIAAYHDKIRECILRRTGPETLVEIHGRLAATLEELGGADFETLAEHFLGGGSRERAVHYYRRAATGATEALAFGAAVRLFGLVVDLAGPSHPDYLALRVAHADALANSGSTVKAARIYEQCASASDDPFELNRKAGYYYSTSGLANEGRAAFEKALATAGMRIPASPLRTMIGISVTLAQIAVRGLRFREQPPELLEKAVLRKIDVCWTVGTGLGLIDAVTGWLFTSRAVLFSLRAGEPSRIARSLAWYACTWTTVSKYGQRKARQQLEVCESIVARWPDPRTRGMLALAKALHAYSTGRWPEAVVWYEQADQVFSNECTATSWECGMARSLLCRTLIGLGHLNHLRRRILQCRSLQGDQEDINVSTAVSLMMEPRIDLASGGPGRTAEVVDPIIAKWPAHRYLLQHAMAHETRLTIALGGEDRQAAWRIVEREWADLENSQLLHNLVLRAIHLPLKAQSALDAAPGSPHRARLLGVAKGAAEKLRKDRQDWHEPIILSIQAGIAFVEGNREAAMLLLSKAASAYDHFERYGNAACCRFLLGQLDSSDDGKANLRRAEAWFESEQVVNTTAWAAIHVPGYHAALAMVNRS